MPKTKPPGSEAQAEIKRVRRSIDRTRKNATKALDKQLRQTLKTIEGMGIYEPKSSILTPYRRKRIRSIQREFKEFLEPGKFFFIPVKDKKSRSKVIERAESLGLTHTKKGFILPKSSYKKAELKQDSKGEFYIKRTGKTKWGVNKGRTYSSIVPIASLDEIDKHKERLLRQAKLLGPILPGEGLIFVIHENGIDGSSRFMFHATEPSAVEKAMNKMFAHIDTYLNDTIGPNGVIGRKGKNKAELIRFYRHIHIEKMKSVEEWKRKYPPKDRGKARKLTKRQRIKGR